MKTRLRLLHLEDNPTDAELTRGLLIVEWPNCEVTRVDTEAEFTAALKTGGFELILADYSLPRFDGLSALALARKLCPDIPVVFLSGAIGDDVAVESLKAGATDYVLKDRPARLIPAMRRALDEAKERALYRQVEAQLRQSEAQYRALVNSIDGIVWQADLPSLRFIFVSQQAERLLGYPVRRWLEEPTFWQDHIHPDDRERAIALCRQIVPEQPYRSFEYRALAADGRVVWLRDIVNVRSQTGETPQIEGIMLDITERKRGEETVRRIQAKLAKSNKDLLRRNREIQNFYHTLSHELKTPLTSAREFVAIVMDGLAGPLNPSQLEYLEIARQSCDQMRLCVNDLLDTTRLETGKLKLELKPTALDAVVNRVITALGPTAAEKKVALKKNIQPGLPEAPLDEHRMTQVITNLLNNALKFTPADGEITVTVGEASGNSNLLQVSVTDTGCGISKDEQERIFDRLYQVKKGDAATEQGVGLGLYLCRELVQLHDGTIWVESELGRGSSFCFVVPKNQQWLRSELLLVDDDPEILQMLGEILRSEDYHVRAARNGREALALMRQQTPDIVLLDLAMPEMDGAAALQEIRKDWGAIPVIVHTGHADSPLMNQALAFSPFTLLAKPCSEEQLLETVRKVQRSGETAIWRKNHCGLPQLHRN